MGGADFKTQASEVHVEGAQLRPGQVGSFLHDIASERVRFIAYRVLEQHRVRLRSDGERWNPLDLVALEEESRRDMESGHAPLAKAARAQYIWARLEGLEPGELSDMVGGPYTLETIAWILDWQRDGRPQLESRLNAKDHAAVRAYAMARLPSSRYLLRWSLEQDTRPGHIAGFLSRDWTDQQRVEILRMWCTSEGWSPLAEPKTLELSELQAVRATLTRLQQSRDPLVRREAAEWGAWLRKRLRKRLTGLARR
jgi:hypothetical protein